MANFDPSTVTGLIGLWDFKSGAETADTGLDDGTAQNGNAIDGNAIAPSYAGDRLILGAGTNSKPTVFDVNADPNSSADDEQFNLDRGTLEVQFEQSAQSGSSVDVVVSRGEKHIDQSDEGFFEIRVTQYGEVQVYHNTDKGTAEITLSTSKGFFSPGDLVNVKYAFDVDTGATLTVENLTTGATETIESDVTGLTFDLTDNDDEEFTFGARETDDSVYDKEFQGSIDYVALYESSKVQPDGAVDGEAFGELMELGYDDSNAPTDQGGDMITEEADLIFGNGGDDTIDGEGGNDTIYGDDASGAVFGGPRESFNWDLVSGSEADSTVTQNTGTVEVTYTRIADTGSHNSDVDNATPLNVAGVDSGGQAIDTNSSLYSETNGEGNTGTFEWAFSEPVGNLEFNINDLDGDGLVTVTAFDADGAPVDVQLVGGADIAVTGNVADATGPYLDPNNPDSTVQVTIAGPVSRVVVEHTQNDDSNSGIFITDLYFDTGEILDDAGGNDVITGGAGADEIYGEGGDDTFLVSSSSDGDGDVITGGNGPDDTLDEDVLDLRGTGKVTITESADATDAGARTGTVTFADGASLSFSQIETILTDPQNEAPTPVDDIVTVAEDEVVIFDPTANDSDPDGDPLTVVSISDPVNGTLTDNGDGTYTYAPNPDYNGPESVTYTVSDPSGETATATVSFDVTPVNDAPDAVNDVATTDEEAPIVLTPLDNDTDVDGDTLRITAATVPTAQGQVTFNDTTITFTPADDFFGEATISYAITDDNGGTDTAEIAVTVANVNDAPVAVDDTVNTLEDTPVTFNPAANDTDVDGDALTVTGVDPIDPAFGTVTLNPDGTVTYQPAVNYNGPVEVGYTVSDPDGLSDTGKILINVGAVPDAPVAEDDIATTPEDVAIVLTPLDNDTDPDGDTLTITGANVPTDQGAVTFTDTTITFTPAANYNGEATISYTITDGNGGTDSAEIAVEVTPVNDDPVAVDDIENTDEDVPITFNPAENDTDVDGDPLVVSAVDPVDPAEGVAVLNPDGTVTFTPAPNFNGPVEIGYTVSDGQGGTDTGVALVNVGPINDAPNAVDDAETTPQGTPVTILPLANDSDPDGDPLRIINATVPASQGTLVFTDTTVEFTPKVDFVGDATIDYTITDGNGLTSSAQITVAVTDVIGPVDGTDAGQLMTPGFADAEGDQIDGTDGLDDTIFGNDGDDTIDGGLGDDTIDGGADDDSIAGGAGDDSVDGGDGADTLAGGAGDDTLNGGGGDDDIAVGGSDSATGGTGDDVFTVDPTDPATDIDATLDGGSDGTDGNPEGPENGDEGDVLDLSDRPEDLVVLLNDPDPESGTVNGLDGDGTPDLTFAEIEKIITGSGDDTVDGDNADGPINVETGAGDDTVDGGDADDVINTGPGDDSVDAGTGDDEVTTGAGNDSVLGGGGDDTISTGNGSPVLDYETFVGIPFEVGAAQEDDKDTVVGGDGNDLISTGDDADFITGDQGNDTIDGGIDDDTINGGLGDDSIIGGLGSDSIYGGQGNDTIIAGIDAFSDYIGDDPNLPDPLLIDPATGLPALSDPNEEDGKDTVNGGAGNDLIITGDDDDVITGGNGDDTINAGIDDDLVDGNDGNDKITGSHGSDTINGGAGDDTIYGGFGLDPIPGIAGEVPDAVDPVPENGRDVIDGGAGNDLIFGEDDDDTINGGTGNDTIDGGVDDDSLRGQDGDDVLLGQQGDDTIGGGAGNDIIDGGSGDDFVEGGAGVDVILGETGNDTLYGNNDTDLILGGADDDEIYGGNGVDILDGEAGDDTVDGGDDTDLIFGEDGDDELIGAGGEDIVLGGTGNDVIYGDGTANNSNTANGGGDILFGEDGDDTIFGGTGDDLIDGAEGADIMSGGDDQDTFIEVGPGDVIDGGEGGVDFDTIILSGPALIDYDPANPENGTITFIDLATQTPVGTATFANIENVTFVQPDANPPLAENDENTDPASDPVNVILDYTPPVTPDPAPPPQAPAPEGHVDGTSGDDVMVPGYVDADGDIMDGNDAILTGEVGDDDIVRAYGGNDSIDSGAGNDEVFAGDGDDVVEGNIGNDVIRGQDGNDTLDGGDGNDRVRGDDGDDSILGGAGNDQLEGGDGADTLEGGDDNDVLVGGDGDDSLAGGEGNDIVSGEDGNDTIDGGNDTGLDNVFGGDDADTFINFGAGDTVTGGEGGEDTDTLDLTGGGPLTINYQGGDPTSEAGTVTFFTDATKTTVAGTLTFSEIENVIPCFTPGTRIATPTGERLVEDLREGDRIITRDNGLQEIRWVGRRDLTGSELRTAPHLKPILIRAGALGRGLPERDMMVSPQHRLLISNERSALYFEDREVLAAAKHLTGIEGVDAVEARGVSYIHFMFDQHEVVLSNGAWTESFQPGEQVLDGMGQAQKTEIFELFPELREADGIKAYQAARRSLKKHEARLLVE
ncbi:tandem-95 repeat protein [Roseovarius aestuariivivens]|uniref:tandem-95 repeat protein n=1 Tax=Roseovarius aestuariivivens TaxID=1888910 RepID=UPI0014369961|nr:tandem-95 repeat protein [Roseovarius aestuariivivens]